MGDLATDTTVEPCGDGRYRATVSADWEIWGPMGGYVASLALRAAGAETTRPLPASLSCHYLGVAQFAPVDLVVTTLREGRVATSYRVDVAQGARPILVALVWGVEEVEGLEHDETAPPEVPGPEGLPLIQELVDPGREPPFAFWRNFDVKPIDFEREWPPDGPRPARWSEWLRFAPTATFADPWVDAARSVILVDFPSWPAGHRPHAWRQEPFTAPTLDLNVAFHRPTDGEPWLLCDGAAPLSTGGLLGWTARVWSPGGTLHASGGGQCLYRRVR